MTVPFSILPAEGSKTFHIPDEFLTRSLPVPNLWDHHLHHSGDHPLFMFDEEDGGIQTIFWSQGVRALHRAGRIVADIATAHGFEPNPSEPPIIGLLSLADHLTTWALMTGIVRAGYSVFLISVRNSSVALTHLLKSTGCKLLFVSGDKPMNELAKAAVTGLGAEGIPVIPMPKYKEVYLPDGTEFEPLPEYQFKMDAPAFIAHSSGSTSFPKPRTITHRILISWALSPYYFPMSIHGKRYALHGLPLFHMLGYMSIILWPTGSGNIACLFRPQEPAMLPTAETILKAVVACDAELLLVVPAMLEAWSADPIAVQKLKRLIYIYYAGGPLQKRAGDLLVSNGVYIKTGMGATEYGPLVSCSAGQLLFGKVGNMLIQAYSPESFGESWEYFSVLPSLDARFVKQDGSEEIYECFIVSSDTQVPCITDTVIDGKPAYSTKDLMLRHPRNPSLWKMYGRTDDQIMHSTGEKTNPGPLETIIRDHPLVKSCIMFGRAQLQAGILIEPVDSTKFNPEDEGKLIAFRNELWPFIEKANAFAPQHSRIFKEMILVASPSIPFQYTPKGTPRRQFMLNEYANHISELYRRVAESLSDIQPPPSWLFQDSLVFVSSVVKRALGRDLEPNADFFQNGADSLISTNIRNSILHALKSTEVKPLLGSSFIYDHPTIASLATFVSGLASGNAPTAITLRDACTAMADMITEFTQDFPMPIVDSDDNCSPVADDHEGILVTGTTGALGSLMLARLLQEPSMKRIYALNRTNKDGTLKTRQREVFVQQGLDLTLLDNPQLELMETDISMPNLGLPKEKMDELRKNTTCIIHNAWRVDFILTLTSYKPLLRGLRNLIDFALESPRPTPLRFLFMSSIATVTNWSLPSPVPEEILSSSSVSPNTGYGQSKWVAEHILHEARIQRNLDTAVIRVGQLCGSRINGNWHPWEWFPALVRASQLEEGVKALPDVSGTVSFLPIDLAASAILETRNLPTPLPEVIHLLHPRPVQWADVVYPLSKRLSVQIVDPATWVNRLEEAYDINEKAGKENHPAFRLRSFYRSLMLGSSSLATTNPICETKQVQVASSDSNKPSYDSDSSHLQEAFGGTLDVQNILQTSATLADPALKQLGEDDVMKWADYWKAIGVLQ